MCIHDHFTMIRLWLNQQQISSSYLWHLSKRHLNRLIKIPAQPQMTSRCSIKQFNDKDIQHGSNDVLLLENRYYVEYYSQFIFISRVLCVCHFCSLTLRVLPGLCRCVSTCSESGWGQQSWRVQSCCGPNTNHYNHHFNQYNHHQSCSPQSMCR